MMWKTSSSYKHRGKILSILMTFKDSVWKKKIKHNYDYFGICWKITQLHGIFKIKFKAFSRSLFSCL